MRDLRELNQYRDRGAERRMYGAYDRDHEEWAGVFRIPLKGSKRTFLCIASKGDAPGEGGMGWDHVSVSLPGRCPTWADMCEIRSLFFLPEEAAFQLHPPEAENISNHAYCLHIWRPCDVPIPMPPSIMVGVQELGEIHA